MFIAMIARMVNYDDFESICVMCCYGECVCVCMYVKVVTVQYVL